MHRLEKVNIMKTLVGSGIGCLCCTCVIFFCIYACRSRKLIVNYIDPLEEKKVVVTEAHDE